MHRILRQTLDISTGSEAGAAGVQHALSGLWQGEGAAAMEQVLDRHAGDTVLRIDRLELDLGRIAGADWLEVFLARLCVAMEDGLADAGTATDEDDAVCVTPRGRASGLTQVTPEGTRAEALLTYLANGWLPWWSDLKAAPGWVAEVVEALAPGARADLIARAAVDPRVLDRLIFALDAGRLEDLLRAALPTALHGRLARLSEALFARTAPRTAQHTAWRRFWQVLFDLHRARALSATEVRTMLCAAWAPLLATDPSRGTPAPRLRHVLRALPTDYRPILRQALRTLQDQGRRPQANPASNARPGAKPDAVAAPTSAADGPALTGAPPRNPDPQAPPDTHAAMSARPPNTEAQDPHIPVTDAGLVLVHPFLPELFTHAGYLADASFTDTAAHHLAVHLLGHVVFATGEAEEADLVLAKILAGLPPDAVLLPEQPAPEHCAAADAMLAAVLTHWSALQSTSPDWLRAQFLHRAGLLARADTGPALHVETRAQDVLLGRLPWGFGIIALPWMVAPLSVKWID